MSMPAPSLPDAWIARIFATMRANYGSAFDRQWACPEEGNTPEERAENAERHAAFMRSLWARDLGHFAANPDAIRYGLENLPPLPPTLPQFRVLCAQRPDTPVQALPAPKPDPAKAAEVLGALKAALQPASDSKDWARKLRDRERLHGGELSTGRPMRAFHRAAWREALEREAADTGTTQ